MFGPFDFFRNTPFDLNHDGKIDPSEQAFIIDQLYPEDGDDVELNGDMDVEDALEEAGIDVDEFEAMDPEERFEALEDAGFDPDDFDEF